MQDCPTYIAPNHLLLTEHFDNLLNGGHKMNISYDDKKDLLYIRLDDKAQDVVNKRVSDEISEMAADGKDVSEYFTKKFRVRQPMNMAKMVR